MKFSRRNFLKLSGTAIAGVALPEAWRRPLLASGDSAWPIGLPLGRVTASRIRLISKPNIDGKRLDYKYLDDVFPIIRSIVGPGFYPHNSVWFETPAGYAYSSWVQPVRFEPNNDPAAVPPGGLYVDVRAPFVDARAQPDVSAPILYRLYYGSTYPVTGDVTAADGNRWYQINDENGITMYAEALYLRPIAAAEFLPLSPEVEEKSIVITLGRQSLSAYERQTEVFRARIASGRTYFGEDGSTVGSLTPAGTRPLWSKRASRHMTGGTPDNGYDLPGVPWVAYFGSDGEAIHGTYWHNDFGTPKSAGCINCRPEDAKWLFRWTMPEVPYAPGNITVQWPGGTRVTIQD